MEKKNTILLTVIAIATLLVAVVGATFAYFATEQNIAANIPVNVNTAGKAAAFTSSVGADGDGEINITVDANEMQQNDADPTGANVSNVADLVTGLTDTATLAVSLKAPVTGQSSVCKYDVIFTWTGEQNSYDVNGTKADTTDDTKAYYRRTEYMSEGETPTATKVPKEFTIVATAAKTGGADGDQTTTNTSAGTINALTEKNFDEYTINTKTVPAPTAEDADATKTVSYIELLKDLKIENADADTATVVTWTFTARFYNSTHDQSIQMGKTFAGTISVNPDTIVC